jgi:hypothetical protein
MAETNGAPRLAQVPAFCEALPLEVESKHAVEARSGQKCPAVRDTNLVAMMQIGIRERLDHAEVLIQNEKLRIGGDEYFLSMERDAPQSTVAAPPLEVDVGSVPIQFQLRAAVIKVDQIDPAMAFAELRAPDHRRGENAR